MKILINILRGAVLCGFMLLATAVFAWDSMGHKIVAGIAYDRLTPAVRQQVDALSALIDKGYTPRQRFIFLATLPDILRGEYRDAGSDKIDLDDLAQHLGDKDAATKVYRTMQDDCQARKAVHQVQTCDGYGAWHFIDQPLTFDGSATQPTPPHNVVWALHEAEQVLSNPKEAPLRKVLYLSFLAHFVGDIHQPLHAVTLYSKQHPDGDGGGNAVNIIDNDVDNLHAYWDGGLGLFYKHNLRWLTKETLHQFPLTALEPEVNDLTPKDWADESYDLDRTFVYKLKEGTRPDLAYNLAGRKIVYRRLALAGYRLAEVLNQVFATQKK